MKLKYELTQDVVAYLLKALNEKKVIGIQEAKDLLTVENILQNPLNKDELNNKDNEK